MRKITAYILLLLICFLPVHAEVILSTNEVNTNSSEIVIMNNGNGEYAPASLKKIVSNTESVTIEPYKDDIFQVKGNYKISGIKNFNKFLKVKEGVFIPVRELKVNLNSQKDILEFILTNEINPYMAKDIYDAAEKYTDGTQVTATLYTPKGVIDSQASSASPSLLAAATSTRVSYVGYKSQNYIDEVFNVTQTGTMKAVKSGTGTKNYVAGVIKNVGNLVVNAVGTYYVGPSYTVLKLFFPNISDFSAYAVDKGDFWQAAINENKYVKYTSIQVYDGGVGKYVYVCRAIGEKEYMYFNHYVYIKSLQSTAQYKTDASTLYTSPSYNSLDVKAYERRLDTIPYMEGYSKWSPNKYTWYSSVTN